MTMPHFGSGVRTNDFTTWFVVDDIADAFGQLVEHLADARIRRDAFTLALSGGSVRPLYERFQHARIPWEITTICWADERLVPEDHSDANVRLARDTFLDHLTPSPRVLPMQAAASAHDYESQLNALPSLDVVHLGMGTDGHTASIFPGIQPPSNARVFDTGDELHPHPRRSLTYAGIAVFSTAIVTVRGAEKAPVIRDVLAGRDLPATHLGNQSCHATRVIWLCDHDAASCAPQLMS